MKVLLMVSLVVNFGLGILYYRESTKPPLEKTIVEEHDEPRVVTKKVFVRVPTQPSVNPSNTVVDSKSDGSAPMGGFIEFDQKAYEQVIEKVSTDRESFLQETLEMTPEDLQKIEKVKKDFYKDADKLILGHSEPTVEQRRQLLDLEEGREKELVKVMGKAKWEKFKKHRDDYNQKNYQRQLDDQTLFIPMEI